MIQIITGPINTGKTTWLQADFGKYANADGFACRKVRLNGEHIGYELVHLKTGEICQFIRKIEHIPIGWNEDFRLGANYSFNKEGSKFAAKIVDEALKKNISRFYIDEIGHLELKNQGFAEILKKILVSKIDSLVIVVRESLVDKVCAHFEIKDYKLIKPDFPL